MHFCQVVFFSILFIFGVHVFILGAASFESRAACRTEERGLMGPTGPLPAASGLKADDASERLIIAPKNIKTKL